MWFKKTEKTAESVRPRSFAYLPPSERYFDSACQTLRPQEVIDAELAYYKQYNACGGRVQYAWGEKVDMQVEDTRKAVLKYFGLSSKEYLVAFTLNTTSAVNLVTTQLQKKTMTRVVTTNIEHNSIFLPALALAKRWDVPRLLLERAEDGALDVANLPTEPIFFCANATSNIDGRHLANLAEVTAHVRAHGGISLIDAAQTASSAPGLIRTAQPDIVAFSGHKLYAPSLGVLIIRRNLLASFDWMVTGGGMVQDVHNDQVTFLENHEALFEPGLQHWAGIIGLGAALQWLEKQDVQTNLIQLLHETLQTIPDLRLLYDKPSATVALWTPKMDSHVLAKALSAQGIMCRSGYFCCHHYLKHEKALPPLLRISLGRHNTSADVEALGSALSSILRYL